jgi:hypothetical protein
MQVPLPFAFPYRQTSIQQVPSASTAIGGVAGIIVCIRVAAHARFDSVIGALCLGKTKGRTPCIPPPPPLAALAFASKQARKAVPAFLFPHSKTTTEVNLISRDTKIPLIVSNSCMAIEYYMYRV